MSKQRFLNPDLYGSKHDKRSVINRNKQKLSTQSQVPSSTSTINNTSEEASKKTCKLYDIMYNNHRNFTVRRPFEYIKVREKVTDGRKQHGSIHKGQP